jgi:hypothetical protein
MHVCKCWLFPFLFQFMFLPLHLIFFNKKVSDTRQAFCTIGPEKWKNDKRKVLNCRRFFHQSNPFQSTSIDGHNTAKNDERSNNTSNSTTTSSTLNKKTVVNGVCQNVPHPLLLVENLLYYLLHHVPSNISMGSFKEASSINSNHHWRYPDRWSFEEFSDYACLLKLVDLSL